MRTLKATKFAWKIWAERFAFLAVASFIIYYSLHAFKTPWKGDSVFHVAAVDAVIRNPLFPEHEALANSGQHSVAFSPYIVLAGLTGRFLEIDAYRTMQYFAVFNLVFYAASLWLWMRAFSLRDTPLFSTTIFLLVSFFLRDKNYGWASETSASTLQFIQAYPSFIGYSLTLLTLVVAEFYLRKPRVLLGVSVLFLQAFTLLSHPLTGSWLIGLLGLRALIETLQRIHIQQPIWPAMTLLASIPCTWLLAVAWPWYNFLSILGFFNVAEGPPFAHKPFRTFASLYLIAVPAFFFFLHRRKHVVWVISFVATAMVFFMGRVIESDFVARYVFFMGFIAQLLVTEALTGSVAYAAMTSGTHAQERSKGIQRRPKTIVMILWLLCVGLGWLCAKQNGIKHLASPFIVAQRPSSHEYYHRQLDGLEQHIRSSDVVLSPIGPWNYTIKQHTGASSVAAPYIAAAPDGAARHEAVSQFFAVETTVSERIRIARRYHATTVVVPREFRSDSVNSVLHMLGTPKYENPRFLVYDIRTWQSAPPR